MIRVYDAAGNVIDTHERAPPYLSAVFGPDGTSGAAARVARHELETLDFAMSLSTITVLKTLAKHVAAHLAERAFCVVFEDDLERCWPSARLKRAVREKEIQSFAGCQGWVAVILTGDSGIRAIFRKLEPSSADYEGSSVVPI